MNRLRRTLCMILSLVLILCAASSLATVEAHAWDAKVMHGNIYASDLEGVDTLCIDGNSKIILQDGDDVTIKCIRFTYNDNSGNRELIIEGSNAGTLRITGSDAGYGFIQMGVYSDLFIKGGHIIVGGDNISSGTMIGPTGLLQMEDGILEVKGNRDTSSGNLYGLLVDRLQILRDAILNVDVSCAGGASAVTVKNMSISGGHVILNAYTSGTGKSANGIGTASTTDGTIGISGGYVSINANAPYGSGYGIYTLYNEDSRNYLTLDGGSINIYGSAYGIHTRTDNDVNIAGSAAVTVTAGKNCALLCGGNLDIRDQAVLKASVRSTSGLWSTYGTVYSKDYAYINPYTSKIVTPAGGKITEQMSGDEYVCSFITDSLGNKAQNVVVGPITNDDALAANKIGVGGGRSFTSDKLYYVNGADSTTGFVSDWNAHYEPETGTLYLRDYEDRSIYVNNVYNKKLTIDLSGTNTITKANAQFGIDAVGNDLEITSVSGGTLSIIGDYQNSNGAGSAAIATNWSGTHDRGTITISGDAVLNIDTGSNEEIDGITAEKDLVIKDHAKVDVKIFYGDDASAYFYGMGAKGSIAITTDRTVNVSIYSRDSWSSTMSRSIYALWPFNFRSANGDSRFNLLNAEYVSFAYVGKPNEGYAATSHLMNALENGLVPDYGFKSFEGNDAQSFILSSKGSPSGAIPVVSAYFPDPGFCAFVADQIDSNDDGWLTQTEMNNVTSIYSTDGSSSDNAKVHSLAGIEWFPNNKWLSWGSGNIRTLDLSVNGKVLSRIELIGIDENPLETIDLSGISALKTIQCWDCKLSELDVSDCSALQQLYCENNTIASLDLTDLTALEGVTCENNGMETLTLGSHPEMTFLTCYGNSLGVVDISKSQHILYAYTNDNSPEDTENYREWSCIVTTSAGSDDAVLRADKTAKFLANNFARCAGAALNLEGRVDILFYVRLPGDNTGWTAKTYFESDNYQTVRNTVALDKTDPKVWDAGKSVFVVSCPNVEAKQMTEKAMLKVFDENGNQVMILRSGAYMSEYCYAAKDWADYMIENGDARNKQIAKALLNYGQTAQEYFTYNTDRPAIESGSALATEMAAKMAAVTVNSAYDLERLPSADAAKAVKYAGMSLNLIGDTEIRLLFGSGDPVVKMGTKTKTLIKSGSIWYASIPNVASQDLGKKYTLKINYDGKTATIKVCALSWANLMLADSTASERNKNMSKALYVYYDAANTYFNH